MLRFTMPRKAVAVTAAVIGIGGLSAGCGSDAESGTTADGSKTDATAGHTRATDASAKASKPPSKACPLVDTDLLPTLFEIGKPKLTERKAVTNANGVTTYVCDVADAGEMFLTVGVVVAPPSGTAEANVEAALGGASGEPVKGIGDAGAFGVKDGVGTVAGMQTIAGKAVMLVVYGNPDDKRQLISVAKSVATQV